jgi:large subunit ribosomal protein L24
MQKVIRRTVLAERQAARRAKVRKSKYDSEKRLLDFQEAILRRRSVIQTLKDARIARREDWQLGQLAPRRDVGAQRDTYGTTDTRLLRGPELPKSEQMKFFPIAAGDRVVIMEGRDKGKIGRVRSTDKVRNELTVDGLNKVRRQSVFKA